MVAPVLELFGVTASAELSLPPGGGDLSAIAAAILVSSTEYFRSSRPDVVVVQGDTTTAFFCGLAAFYEQIPVVHVEAGLRTRDLRHPFPEELNRVLIARIANLHFAATAEAVENLSRDGVREDAVFLVGNTGIDALLFVRELVRRRAVPTPITDSLDRSRKLILVTAHRRENHGAGLQQVAAALLEIARSSSVEIVWPVHPNPMVRRAIPDQLRSASNVHLVEPLDYGEFVSLLDAAYVVVTDSGGIQEEAPALGKPLVVLREKTERPEGVAAGTAVLVGSNQEAIVRTTNELLNDDTAYQRASRRHYPYGDGTASPAIARILRSRIFLTVAK